MALAYLGEELIESIRNIGMAPSTGSTGSRDADLLRHANEAFRTKILPEMIRIREEYFVSTIRIPLVAGTSKYRLPSRAVGNRVRDLMFVDSSVSRNRIAPVGREEIFRWSSPSTSPERYYIEGNHIVLVPDTGMASSGWLEVSYYFRPGEVVISTSARQVTAVNAGTNMVTLASNVPFDWTSSLLFDVHSKYSGAEIHTFDAAASSVSGATITFTNEIAGATVGTKPIEVGDWVCKAGEAAIPAIPIEMHPVLARATAVRIAEANGDQQAVNIHAQLFKDDMHSALAMLENRIEGKPLVIGGKDGLLWQTSQSLSFWG